MSLVKLVMVVEWEREWSGSAGDSDEAMKLAPAEKSNKKNNNNWEDLLSVSLAIYHSGLPH